MIRHQFDLNLVYYATTYHNPAGAFIWQAYGNDTISGANASDCRSWNQYSVATPSSENPVVATAPFSHQNRRFRWYSTFMHTCNGYFHQSVLFFYITVWHIVITTDIATAFLIIFNLFGSPGHNFIGVYQWSKAIQLMGGPGYSFYFKLINIIRWFSSLKKSSWQAVLNTASILCLFNIPK